MATYKTPGVYIEEISTLPPSVAEVSTAVPAFIGRTELHSGADAVATIDRIGTLLEYQQLFGTAPATDFEATVAADGSVSLSQTSQPQYLMYYAIDLYFKNGGGPCYIVSTGTYSSGTDNQAGLDLLGKQDEPTLILSTDVPASADSYYDYCEQVLNKCNNLGDGFGIFDVLNNNVEDMRNKLGMNYLAYGEAYTP